MSWRLKKKFQGLLAEERGTVRKDWGGKIAFALVYPNTYAVGMSNLGFQTIYRHLNALPDVVCERVFLPDPEDIGELGRTEGVPISLESFRPLTDFHMVGFSVTYEGDYVNVLRLLTLAGIPLRPEDRRSHDPLVLMGGVDAFRETVARVAASGETRVGLVGACVSDYPWIGELLKIVEDHGLELSISSIRADSLTDPLVAALARGGHRTLTVAPEAGTERLRRAIRKAITDEQILAACDLVRAHGIPNLKTYFMIGQPTETLEDVEAIPRLAERMLERLCVPDPKAKPFGRLTLSISSFVPKPWTPFQWAPFAGAGALQAKLEIVKHGVRRLHNVRVLHENPREAALQALLARGDRRVADFLELAASFAGDWRRALREWKGDPDFCTTRVRSTDERLPWDHFDVGVKKAGLIREWERAQAERPVTSGAA